MATQHISLLLIYLFVCLGQAALPHGWKTCKLSSKDFEKCLAKEIEKAVKTLKDGDRKLGIQPVDPLVLGKLIIDQGSGPVSIKLEFTNYTIEGLKNITIMDLKGDFKSRRLTCYLDQLLTKGQYKMNGKILTLPVVGEGMSVITWKNMTLKYIQSFKPIEKNGKTYYLTDKLSVDLQPKMVHFQFDNLFNGNKELGDAMQLVLNKNWAEILEAVKPAISKALTLALTSLADTVLEKIPISEYVIS